MKRILSILLVCAAVPSTAIPADSQSEQDALAAMRNPDATPAMKDAALALLKRSGTTSAVPVLAAFLANEDHGSWALDALATMPCKEAGHALCSALLTTGGRAKAAVAHALGERRDPDAVPGLIKLLTDPDAMIAGASAQALGRIGGDDAVAAMMKARPNAPASLQRVLAEALLDCAARECRQAATICEVLSVPNEPGEVRAAAFRTRVLLSGDDGIAMIREAIKGEDGALHVAAMPLVRDIPGPHATKKFAAALSTANPPGQVALIEALNQRGDEMAADAVAALTRSSDAAVRLAAIRALGSLGDVSSIPVLVDALSGVDAVRDAAKAALQRLYRGDVGLALVAHIETAPPNTQVELIQTIVKRGEKSASSALMKLARGNDAKVSVAAVRALQELATESQADAMLDLVRFAKSDAVRGAAESAFVALAARASDRDACVAMTLKAMQAADASTRCALLRTAGRIGGKDALAALLASARDTSDEIRDASVRAMADFSGIEAIPHLLMLARESAVETHRVIAIRGYWRLVASAEHLPVSERLKLCEDGLNASARSEEKRLGLVELGKVGLPAALELAKTYSANPETKAESAVAVNQIRVRIGSSQRGPKGEGAAESAGRFIRDWLVCGPYGEAGITGASNVFPLAFGPEKSGAPMEWRPVPKSDHVNLAGLFPGKSDCVAYLKTEIVSPMNCDATLLLGSDDGVKAWLNGAVVFANNIDRNFVPDQDAAPVKLIKGTNVLMLKISQGGGGWTASARIVRAGGVPLEQTSTDGTLISAEAHIMAAATMSPP